MLITYFIFIVLWIAGFRFTYCFLIFDEPWRDWTTLVDALDEIMDNDLHRSLFGIMFRRICGFISLPAVVPFVVTIITIQEKLPNEDWPGFFKIKHNYLPRIYPKTHTVCHSIGLSDWMTPEFKFKEINGEARRFLIEFINIED